MCVHTGSTHICTCKNYVHMLYMYFILFQLFLVDFSLQFFPGDGSVGWADGDTGAGGEEETDDETGGETGGETDGEAGGEAGGKAGVLYICIETGDIGEAADVSSGTVSFIFAETADIGGEAKISSGTACG